MLLSSHSATSPGERRLILQPENFSIQNSVSERSRVGRVGRSGWSWDSSTPVVGYTDNTRAWSCPALSALHLTAHPDTAGMGGSRKWDLYLLSLCVRFQSNQEQKEGKKGEQGKPRSENPKEVAGYDGNSLNKKKKQISELKKLKQVSEIAHQLSVIYPYHPLECWLCL